MKKILAFTLAETLIVMGIIGVVAALTLPNLNSSTGDKEKVAKVKKIYQNLNDALGRAEAVYGPMTNWCSNINKEQDCSKIAGERITEFMKVSKNCGIEKEKGCFASGGKMLDNSAMDNYDNLDTIYKIITPDGTSVGFLKLLDSTIYGGKGRIYIDIDGPNKGPNIMGKDNFVFVMDENNCVIPYGPHSYSSWDQADANERKQGDYAAWWIIDNDNMDYLKCPDKLSETVTSCN